MNEDDRASVALSAAIAGAELAFDRFRTGIHVETKTNKTDVVTAADRDAQRRVIETITEHYPDHAVVGEEADARKTVPDTGPSWIVDPIDGTNNYVHNARIWATSVATVDDGEPIAAANVLPAIGDTYTADETGAYRNGDPITVSTESDPEACSVCPTMWWDFDDREAYANAGRAIVTRFGDLKRYGSAQASLSMVADGSLDGVITNLDAHPWDTVAGVYLIRQAGGRVTDLNGDRWRHDSIGLVASNGEVHDDVLAAARAIDPDSLK
ncbi:inositol monophosphatase family protein [Halalkalirubrum salinum]|uniref:inositol monophosphatase family protein n=1 Tax=Halalkalirubrum salinum TaxID=2563889 RepID=UPI0010FBA669|nr:inositol monophosphatase [Halalkalirubrum salinum]